MRSLLGQGRQHLRDARRVFAMAVVLCALAWLALSRVHVGARSERVYSVAQVVDGLTLHPSAWSGRVVLVRCRVTIVSFNRQGDTLDRAPRLVDVNDPGKGITMEWDHLGPIPNAMLALPFLDRLVAGRLNGVGVYRVRLAHRVLTAVPVVSPLPVTISPTNPPRPATAQVPSGARLAYDDAILVGDLN